MSTVERPLSPFHIYKPQLTSILSITHRGTGVFLSLGAILLCLWLTAVAAGPATYAVIYPYIPTWYGKVFIFLFLFSLYFHLFNGIRHLFWDIGLGLDIKTTYQSGYTVVIASIVFTIATWFISINTMGAIS